jgi:hypothetical protein
MEGKYHGIISHECRGIPYENWYNEKRKTEKEIRRKSKDLVRNSLEDHISALDFGSMTISGVRIC